MVLFYIMKIKDGTITIEDVPTRWKAVSYTHLDVYKRQAVSAVSKTMSGDLSRGLSMNPQIAYAANQSVNVNIFKDFRLYRIPLEGHFRRLKKTA